MNEAVEETAKSIAGSDYKMPREKARDVGRQVEYNAAMRENFERPDAMLTTGEFKAREKAGLSNFPSVNPAFRDTEFLAQNQYIPGGSWYFRGSPTMRGMTDGYGSYKSPTTSAPGMPSGINYPSSSRGQYRTQPPPSVFPGLRPNYLGNVQTNVATKGQPRKPSNSTAGLRTGSWKPQTQAEKALEAQVRRNPLNGAVLSTKMGDPRWNAKDGWVKMEQTRNGVTIHYNYNQRTREVEDVKVEGPSKNGLPPLRRPPK